MAIVNELVTSLGFKIDQTAMSTLRVAKESLKGIVKLADKLGKTFTVAKGIMDYFTGNVVLQSQDLLNLSKTTGISTDALQRWTFAAKAAGVGTETIINDIKNLKNLKGLTDQGIIEWMTELSQMDTPSALRTLQELGLSQDFLALVKGRGAGGVLELLREADKFILSREEVENSARYAENMNKFFSKLDMMKKKALVELSPEFDKQLDKLTKWLEENDYFINEITTLGKGLAQGFQQFFDIIGTISKFIKDTFGPIIGDWTKDLDGVKVTANLVTGALLVMTGSIVMGKLLAFGKMLKWIRSIWVGGAAAGGVAAGAGAAGGAAAGGAAAGAGAGFLTKLGRFFAGASGIVAGSEMIYSQLKGQKNWFEQWSNDSGLTKAIADLMPDSMKEDLRRYAGTQWQFTLEQNFYGPADKSQVASAAENGIRNAMDASTGLAPLRQ